MFYSHEILRKRGGKFGIIWIAATKVQQLSRKGYSSVKIRRTCDEIIEYITLQAGRDRDGSLPRFSLYLSSQLMYGVCRVYLKQQEYLFTDVSQLTMKFVSSTCQRTDKIDLHEKRYDDATMPDPLETIPDPLESADYYDPVSDVKDVFRRVPNQDYWTRNGLYDSEVSPASDVVVSPNGDPLPDMPVLVESPSFTTEPGPMQSDNSSITLRDAAPAAQRVDELLMPVGPDLPPADTMLEMFAMGDLSEIKAHSLYEEEQERATRGPSLTDGLLGPLPELPVTKTGQDDLSSDDRVSPMEETPAVPIDPETLGLDERPQRALPASPAVTPVQTHAERRAERQERLRDDLNLQLSPLAEEDTPRTKRRKRRLLFADDTIQMPTKQLALNREDGQGTSRNMILAGKKPQTVQQLFNRPYSKVIQQNSRFLNLWKRNIKTHNVADTTDSDLEYPIWSVPELGADSSSTGSDKGSPGQFPEIPQIPTPEHDDEDPAPQRTLPPVPEEGVSMEALREASVSHIEIGRDASLRDRSGSGQLSDFSTPHLSMLSRSADSSHLASVTDLLDSSRKSRDLAPRDSMPLVEEQHEEMLVGDHQMLQVISEDAVIPTSPVIEPMPLFAQEGRVDTAPRPHHNLMRAIKRIKSRQFVTFTEICPFTETKEHATSLFSALLDLCTLGRLSAAQEEPFTPIHISKGPKW